MITTPIQCIVIPKHKNAETLLLRNRSCCGVSLNPSHVVEGVILISDEPMWKEKFENDLSTSATIPNN